MKIPTHSIPDFKGMASKVVQEKNVENRMRYLFTIALDLAAHHIRDEINCNQDKFRRNPLLFVALRLEEIEKFADKAAGRKP